MKANNSLLSYHYETIANCFNSYVLAKSIKCYKEEQTSMNIIVSFEDLFDVSVVLL